MRRRSEARTDDRTDSFDSTDHDVAPSGPRLAAPRSKGAVSGLLLLALGVWGAVVPYVGPSFDIGFGPDSAEWTAGRFWMQLLPGAVAALCGLVLLMTRNRAVGVLAGWVAVVAGAWYVVGPVLAVEELETWSSLGAPLGDQTQRTIGQLSTLSGLGVAIAVLGALAIGRMSVRSLADVEHASALAAARRQAELDAEREEHDAGLDIGRDRAHHDARHDEDRHVAAQDGSTQVIDLEKGSRDDAVARPSAGTDATTATAAGPPATGAAHAAGTDPAADATWSDHGRHEGWVEPGSPVGAGPADTSALPDPEGRRS